jgi:O-antigen ligase
MSPVHMLLAAVMAGVAVWQLVRVPRLWAFLIVFLVLFPKVPLAVVPGNTTPLRVDDVVVAVVLGSWLLARVLDRRTVAPAAPVTVPLMLYLGVALTATLLGLARLTTTPGAGLFHFLRLLEYALLYYFFYRSIRPDEARDVVRVLAGTWLVVAFVWIVQQWTIDAWATGTIGNWATYAPSFSASYDFGGYVMMSVLVFYAAWFYGGVRTWSVGLSLATGLFIALNADSRASLVGLLLALLVDVFVRLRVGAALGLVAAGVAVPFALQTEKMERLIDIVGTFDLGIIKREFTRDYSIEMRLDNWTAALDRWQQSPLLGDGLGSYLQYVRHYGLPATPDGWYIRTLAETGLLGLLVFALLIGAILWTLLSVGRYPNRVANGFLTGGALVVFAAAANAFFIDTFVSLKMMAMFWFVVAVATRIAADAAPDVTPRLGMADA